MDRGFVVAIAHVRGGQEMGRAWYEDGRLLNKRNTFADFIAVTGHLVHKKYAARDKVFAQGGSAGGLLMGVVANLAPDNYRGIVANVPFVDIVTTMLDESIPLTTNEFDEWGNPKDKTYYNYMLSYSPYDNVEEKSYPAMLVTSGLWDSQVPYWEAAKWVAKLRAKKTDTNLLLFKVNMQAGHGGKSGRFQRLRETAIEYQFILNCLGARLFDRHRLRQVARLIDVGAAFRRDVIGEQLQRHRHQHRRQHAVGLRHLDNFRGDALQFGGRVIGHGDNPAVARFDFLEIRHRLLEQVVVGNYHHHRHLVVDKRDRPMLHLARRITLGVDVGNFLELERALERDRIVDAAAEEQEVPRLRILARDLLNIRLALEDSFDLSGNRERRLQQLARVGLGQASHPRREMNREQVVSLELREKALVVVTLVSGPHRVYNCASALRAIDESTVLVIASRCAPRARPSSIAARVSAVSPDCDTAMIIVRSSIGGRR